MKSLLISFAFTLLYVGFTSAQEGDKIAGVWLPSDGRSMIKIEKIGSKFFGRVVWLKEPNDENGNPRKDVNNPDEKLRETPIKGYRVLKDFVWNEDDKIWENGTIYDPKNGTTYSCKIEPQSDNKIEVRGFVGTEMFGRTDVWTRLEKKKK